MSLVPDDLGAETYRRVVAALAVDEQPTESRRQVLNAILDLLGDDLEHLPTPSQVVDAVVAQIASRLSLPVDLPWLLSRLDTGLQERPAEALLLALGELKRALAGRTATQPAIVERSWSAFEIVSPDSAPALRWTGANLQVARFRQRRAIAWGCPRSTATWRSRISPSSWSARGSARAWLRATSCCRAPLQPPAPVPPAPPATSPAPSDSTQRSIPTTGRLSPRRTVDSSARAGVAMTGAFAGGHAANVATTRRARAPAPRAQPAPLAAYRARPAHARAPRHRYLAPGERLGYRPVVQASPDAPAVETSTGAVLARPTATALAPHQVPSAEWRGTRTRKEAPTPMDIFLTVARILGCGIASGLSPFATLFAMAAFARATGSPQPGATAWLLQSPTLFVLGALAALAAVPGFRRSFARGSSR